MTNLAYAYSESVDEEIADQYADDKVSYEVIICRGGEDGRESRGFISSAKYPSQILRDLIEKIEAKGNPGKVDCIGIKKFLTENTSWMAVPKQMYTNANGNCFYDYPIGAK